MSLLYERDVGAGLRYREVPAAQVVLTDPFMIQFWREMPKRGMDCQLVMDGIAEPISYLSIVTFPMRFGAVSVKVEGIGGVATKPAYRRKGYASLLLREALARCRTRAPVVFLNGLKGLYGRFGFRPTWPKEHATASVEAIQGMLPAVPPHTLRPWQSGDREPACALYNQLHALRPCTAVREPATYIGLRAGSDWARGEAGLVLERQGRMVGYAIMTASTYNPEPPFELRELVALEATDATVLLRATADHAREGRAGEMTLQEPLDTPAGLLFKKIGCRAHLRFEQDGGWMGLILDREGLLQSLAGELARRGGEAPDTLRALIRRELITDDGALLGMLTGHWSWDDALRVGTVTGTADPVLQRWFPGSGGLALPHPFLHPIDRF